MKLSVTRSNENQPALSEYMELTYNDQNERRKILPKDPWHIAPEKEGPPEVSRRDASSFPVDSNASLE